MSGKGQISDSVHWYVSELTSRIVAESGTASDRFHLGKIILQSFKDEPTFIAQINGGTGESETNESVLKRSVQCATALRNYGFKKGDVMVLMAPNHIDLCIPFYAALFLGIIISPIDETLGINELEHAFSVNKPSIIFCQKAKISVIKDALNKHEINTKIIAFDEEDRNDICSFPKFMDSGSDVTIEDFKPTDFNPENTIVMLIPTSGTTGLPKAAAVSHKKLVVAGPYLWIRYTEFPTPTRMWLVVSPLQWLTAIISYITGAIVKITRLQSSKPITQEHAYYLINTYRPTYTIMSPTMMTTLMNPEDKVRCDFTCFESILLGGSAVPKDLVEDVKKISPKTQMIDVYGMSELCMLGFQDSSPPLGSCGKRYGLFQYKLVDIETGNEITEPNVPGELWMKGPSIFLGYYSNPDETRNAFEDGWFKTGDMFRRDENWNYYFVERIKLLLKYKNHQISPVEIEAVIRRHPGVLDAAVTGVPRRECGDVPVACVVPRAHCTPTAHEIKDLVRDNLTDSKHLRGGVIFLDKLPTTATGKIHRTKLREMALHMERL